MIRIIAAIVVLSVSVLFAGDWEQWRGPAGNGSSDETGLPDALTPETMLWNVSLPGQSAATPVIADGKLYLASTMKGSSQLLALCFDAATGELLWQKEVAEADRRFAQGNTCASNSPCADATGAVFLFGQGTFVKFAPDGQQLWQRNLEDDYGPLAVKYGYSASGLLYDNRVYISVLRDSQQKDSTPLDSYLLCINNDNGQTLFKVNRQTDAKDESTNAYTSPTMVTVNGQRHIVIAGADYVTGHNLDDGTELWRHRYSDPRNTMDRLVPTPVSGDERLYYCYPRGTITFAMDLNKIITGEDSLLWTNTQRGPDVSCPLLYDGSLYLINDRQTKELICLDCKTGKVRWTGQLDKSDQYYASATAADGKLYLVNRRGVVTVIAADRTAFKILSTHSFGERPVDSTISIANGRLYLRTAERLYCFAQPLP